MQSARLLRHSERRKAEQRIGRPGNDGRRAESSIARNRLGDSMGVERQHGMGDQLYLWEELAPVRPGVSGKGGIRASACEEQQTYPLDRGEVVRAQAALAGLFCR